MSKTYIKNIFKAIVLSIYFNTISYSQTKNEKQEIYTAATKDIIDRSGKPISSYILINNRTNSGKFVETIQHISTFIEEDRPIPCNYPDNIYELIDTTPTISKLLLQLNMNAKKSIKLKNCFPIDNKYIIISKTNYNNYLAGTYKHFKNNNIETILIEFSNISIIGEYAAVYCAIHLEDLNASGTIMILRREQGIWKIISRPEFWVS